MQIIRTLVCLLQAAKACFLFILYDSVQVISDKLFDLVLSVVLQTRYKNH